MSFERWMMVLLCADFVLAALVAWQCFNAPVREDLARVDRELDELASAGGEQKGMFGGAAGRGEDFDPFLPQCRDCGMHCCECGKRDRWADIEEAMSW